MEASNTIYLDPDARLIAEQQVSSRDHASYQHDLLAGHARWSGADLRGKAQQWSVRYKLSRLALIRKLRAAGLAAEVVKTSHGKMILVVSSEDATVGVAGDEVVTLAHPSLDTDTAVTVPPARIAGGEVVRLRCRRRGERG